MSDKEKRLTNEALAELRILSNSIGRKPSPEEEILWRKWDGIEMCGPLLDHIQTITEERNNAQEYVRDVQIIMDKTLLLMSKMDKENLAIKKLPGPFNLALVAAINHMRARALKLLK